MNQGDLWHDSIFDAVGAAVQACGGRKVVAGKLWPALDSDTAAARLRGALNPEHAQKLCIGELLLIARLAKAAGDNSVMEFMARDLGYELKSLTPAETKKRAKRARINALMDELRKLQDDE